METNNNSINNTPVKSKLPVIIISVIAALIVCIGGFFLYWINRPIYKIDNAFVNGYDLDTIEKYYPKLNEDDLASVDQRLLNYAEKLYDDYYDEDEDYETVSSIYNNLAENMLKDNATFQKYQDDLLELKLSRDNFALAKEAYNTGDYISAMEHSQSVSPIDRNYSDAQKIYEDSKRLNIIGSWSAKIDLSDAFAEAAGFEFDEPLSLPVELICTFNPDGTGAYTFDTNNTEALVSGLTDAAFQLFLKQLADAYGLDRSMLESVAGMLGFSDIYSLFSSQISGIDIEGKVTDILSSSEEFTYTINEDSVDTELKDLHSTLKMESDGSLTLNDSDSQYLFEVPSVKFIKKTVSF